MILSNDQLDYLKIILQENCYDDKAIPRSDIYIKFKHKYNDCKIEQYLFERIISKLIKDKIISGYKIKPGRSGGIIKNELIENITLKCSQGIYTGYISLQELKKFITKINK